MITSTDLSSKGIWEDIAQKERARRDATLVHLAPSLPAIAMPNSLRVISIPNNYLPAIDATITETPPEKLVKSLMSGELKSVAVIQAFLQRARIAQKLVNCVTELLTERALARAKELDEHLAKYKKPVGPLHGLPVSIKEHIGLEGLDINAGIVSWIGKKSPATASVVQLLEALGAVCYVRTTEPQALLMLECTSNIYGTTLNRHSTLLTSGGSSGGESALLTLNGSPLGLGGDIAGSIRVPAANCGIFGLRPTSGRIPLMGVGAPTIGCETIIPSLGPMSRTIGGIKLFMEALMSSRPWENDPTILPIPWRAENQWLNQRLASGKLGGRGLRVGILWDDGVVKPLPPVVRALEQISQKLSGLPGVEVVDWKPHQNDKGLEILTKLLSTDGGMTIQGHLDTAGEPWVPLVHWNCQSNPNVERLDMPGLWSWTFQRDFYRYSYFQAWKKADIDLLISPVGPSPAPQHGTSRYLGYSAIWNLLDYPGLAFPVTQVNLMQDSKDESYVSRNDDERWIWEHYEAEKEVGAPVGLQLVGQKLEDEKVVEVMSWMVQALQLPFVELFS